MIHQPLFSKNTKMAKLLFTDPRILLLLPRFGIRLGFGESSVEEVCLRYQTNPDLFVLVANVVAHNHYTPSDDELEQLDIHQLTDYLRSSHQYYLEEKMALIEQSLQGNAEGYSPEHWGILSRFFNEYKQEVVAHFDYEERAVFPYIETLLKGERDRAFRITQYGENHSNIEDKLSDLKNILIKYIPEEFSTKDRTELLYHIFLLEEELEKHSWIEDKILVPYVKKLEERLR